jgi:hypothetical protein
MPKKITYNWRVDQAFRATEYEQKLNKMESEGYEIVNIHCQHCVDTSVWTITGRKKT